MMSQYLTFPRGDNGWWRRDKDKNVDNVSGICINPSSLSTNRPMCESKTKLCNSILKEFLIL